MPTAVVNQSECRIHLKSERLEVFGRNDQTQREEVLREIPIRDLDRLIVTESVQITSHALAALLRARIPVNIVAWSGQFLGGFLPAQNSHGEARLRQYGRTLDAAFALQMAGRILTAKLYNQRRVLQRLNASRTDAGLQEPARAGSCERTGTPMSASANGVTAQGSQGTGNSAQAARSEIQDAIAWLDHLFGSLSRSQSMDEIRGYEGVATARYFQGWASFLPKEFPFQVRSTRPPLNAVNACISFGATLLYTETVAFLHAHGLDPSLGLLHKTEDGRWSLALDLLEPFRPVLVEALALDLFSHQILNNNHFESRDGGVFLNEDGRKKFFLQYERRMERQFLSESVGHRTTLRQQVEEQVIMFKSALNDPARFEPFLMN